MQDETVRHGPPAHPSPVPDPPAGLARLVAQGAVDAELGALLWLLRERGVPALVIGAPGEEAVPAIADAVESIEAAEPPASGDRSRTVRTLRATSLLEAFAILADDPFNLNDDAIRSLGIVLVARDGRVVAAHYLRPVERDREGHLQHRPPAVLATWQPDEGRFEHFAWAVTPELAFRIGGTQAELEETTAARARQLGSGA